MTPNGGSDAGLNWGIVGTGAIARHFAADLAFVPGARLHAVCSRRIDTAEAFARSFSAPAAYGALDAFLADPAIAAVYIATPNALHAAQAIAALAAGKPVLVEKPLATSLDEAQAVAEAARTSGLLAMEALWTRFLPAVAAMRRTIAAGRIGAVRRIEAELAYARPFAADSRFYSAKLGGGALRDLGVYPLSLALHLLGAPASFTGRWTAAPSGVDAAAQITLRFADAFAEIACGFDRDGANGFLVEGSGGALRLDAPFLSAQGLTLFRSAEAARRAGHEGRLKRLAARLAPVGRAYEHHGFAGYGLHLEAAAFMERLRVGDREAGLMPLADSIAAARIIDGVLATPPVQQLLSGR